MSAEKHESATAEQASAPDRPDALGSCLEVESTSAQQAPPSSLATTSKKPLPLRQPPRPPRPNYGRIHSKPFPLDIFPIPQFIPHNPLSLFHIAYVFLSHLLHPPSSHSTSRPRGWYDEASNSVGVTETEHIRTLWERGFFGKGSLSRSEPTWLERERKRLGLVAKDTAEEYTQQRRTERRKMKMERAMNERKAIEETIRVEQEGGLSEATGDERLIDVAAEEGAEILGKVNGHEQANRPDDDERRASDTLGAMSNSQDSNGAANIDEAQVELEEPENQEHLQLCPEEAFFLHFGLGVLDVYNPMTLKPMATSDLLAALRSNSYFPPRLRSELVPYDPFLLSYAAYHHFRSLGWVVRQGLKFAVNWLLYLRGPAFAHAEFAVVVLPSFRDEYWWEEERKVQTLKMQKRDWWWLHCLQRVQSQVQKGLIICWVEVPRPRPGLRVLATESERTSAEQKGIKAFEGTDIVRLLKGYKVREMAVRRWTPNRNRD